jgi:hypothetical protein
MKIFVNTSYLFGKSFINNNTSYHPPPQLGGHVKPNSNIF